MEKKLHIVLVCTLLVLVFFVGQSWAKTICQPHPQSQWLKTDALTKILKEQGYIIDTWQVVENCYEMVGLTEEGLPTRLYFDTVSGDVMKSETQGDDSAMGETE